MTKGQPKNAFEWSRAYFRNEDRSLMATRSTMAALMTYADFEDLTCYPSQATLARITGASVDTVSRHIKRNIEAGWLVRLALGSSRTSSSRYRLAVPTPRRDAGGSTPTPRKGAGSTPRKAAGSTPRSSAALTTHGSTHGSTQLQGPLEGGPMDLSSNEKTKHVATPRNSAGSSPGTDAGGWPPPDLSTPVLNHQPVTAGAGADFAAPPWFETSEATDSGDVADPFSSAYQPPANRGA